MLGGTSPTGQLEVRRACAVRPACAEDQAQADAKADQIDHCRQAFRHSGQPRAWYVNERGERELSFSMLSRNGDDLNAAIGKVEGALRGFRASATLPRRARPIGPRSASCRTSMRLRGSALRPIRSPKRSALRRSATPTSISRSSPSATGRFRSACSSRRRREPRCKQIEQLARHQRRRQRDPAYGRCDRRIRPRPEPRSTRFDRERRAVVGVDLDRGCGA